LASWFFIHYRKSVTSNTFQFRDDSESKSAINKTFCDHRLHWFKKIKSDLFFSNAEWNYNREREKSKYLDNISVLPTSIFIFDKFVDGAQPEVAGRRHILRTLGVQFFPFNSFEKFVSWTPQICRSPYCFRDMTIQKGTNSQN
jgi:hypothetical protein